MKEDDYSFHGGAFGSAVATAPTESSTTGNNAGNSNDNEQLQLPRVGGNRGVFLRDTIQHAAVSMPTKKVFKSLGNQLSKLNLGKLIDQMESDQGLADSLEQLNCRMKEEVERQEIRREAELTCKKVITDHLEQFLIAHPNGTYEEWIQDLHPENANQGRLLSDIQQIDERFYVFGSDHRILWNEAVRNQQQQQQQQPVDDVSNNYAHRLVEARTQLVESSVTAVEKSPMIDLINDSVEFQLNKNQGSNNLNKAEVDLIDFFAETSNTPHAGNDADEKKDKQCTKQ